MNNIPVIAFAAYSGTGKTTLIEQIILKLKARNYRLAVIKHDAHRFEIDKEGKDSCILREEPFVYARDSIEFKVYLMVWKKGILNRKVELEMYSAEE